MKVEAHHPFQLLQTCSENGREIRQNTLLPVTRYLLQIITIIDLNLVLVGTSVKALPLFLEARFTTTASRFMFGASASCASCIPSMVSSLVDS